MQFVSKQKRQKHNAHRTRNATITLTTFSKQGNVAQEAKRNRISCDCGGVAGSAPSMYDGGKVRCEARVRDPNTPWPKLHDTTPVTNQMPEGRGTRCTQPQGIMRECLACRSAPVKGLSERPVTQPRRRKKGTLETTLCAEIRLMRASCST